MMNAMPKAEFICYWCLLFWRDLHLHFVADSKGNNDIIDVEKNMSRSENCPKSEKKGKYFTSFRHFSFV